MDGDRVRWIVRAVDPECVDEVREHWLERGALQVYGMGDGGAGGGGGSLLSS